MLKGNAPSHLTCRNHGNIWAKMWNYKRYCYEAGGITVWVFEVLFGSPGAYNALELHCEPPNSRWKELTLIVSVLTIGLNFSSLSRSMSLNALSCYHEMSVLMSCWTGLANNVADLSELGIRCKVQVCREQGSKFVHKRFGLIKVTM